MSSSSINFQWRFDFLLTDLNVLPQLPLNQIAITFGDMVLGFSMRSNLFRLQKADHYRLLQNGRDRRTLPSVQLLRIAPEGVSQDSALTAC